MQEDGWAGLRDEHGVIQEESLMALRVNLLFDTPETQTNVLVSLTRPRRTAATVCSPRRCVV